MDKELKKKVENAYPVSTDQTEFPPCTHAILNNDFAISLANDSTIEDVESFEQRLKDVGLDIVAELDPYCVKENVTNGLYSRTLFMPKNLVVVGALHKEDYIDIMIAGDLTVKNYFANGEVEDAKRYRGLNQFEGKAGRKRVLITHEDCLWVTVDKTPLKTIEGAKESMCFEKFEDSSYLGFDLISKNFLPFIPG